MDKRGGTISAFTLEGEPPSILSVSTSIHSCVYSAGHPPSPAPFPPPPPSGDSGPQQLLDKVARHAVEEEAQHDEQQQGQHDLDDQPLVAVAHQVADGFQRAQEPQEGGVWATKWDRGGGFRGGRCGKLMEGERGWVGTGKGMKRGRSKRQKRERWR